MQSDTASRERDPAFVRNLFSSIAARYDLANHVLSGGADFFWRRRASSIVKGWEPGAILDLATGSGDLAISLRRACPDAAIVAADFCHPMLLKAKSKGIPNLVAADGLRLPFADASFDAVTIAFGLRNMASWPGALAEMARVLRPGGHLLLLDFSIPGFPLRGIYRFYLRHCLPWIAGVLTGEPGAYEYLGESIERFPHGAAMLAMMGAAGFSETRHEPLTGGIASLYRGRHGVIG